MSSCQECSRPTKNNKYANCPPRMADGRNFTDYRPRCFQQYVVDKKLMNSFDQRMYLTQNAEYLMKKNATTAYLQNRCGPCEEPYDVGTMLPERVQQVCDANSCTFNITDPYGLGLGRQYIMTDEDQAFHDKFLAEKAVEQQFFKSRNISPYNLDPQFYPIDGVTNTSYDRFAVPSQGTPLVGN